MRQCDDCQSLIWYPRAICPECSSLRTSWLEVSGRGTVYSYTVNYRGEGAYRDRGPYVLAYVELDEGPRMMTNIVDAGDTGVAVGMPVEVVFHDTGEGSALNVARTVRAYERAGVAAIQFEDQVFPKRCGHLAGKEVISAKEFTSKLRAALDTRQADTVIIARTDARAPAGIDEAIDRANTYAGEGADVIFVEAPESGEEIERVAAEVSAPLLFNVVPGGRSPVISETDLERLGFRIAIYPAALLGAAAAAMTSALTQLGGRDIGEVTDVAGIFGLVGLGEWLEFSERYR